MSLKKASELPEGGIITEPGNAHEYNTGDWRTFVPQFIEENCIHCLFCWICWDAVKSRISVREWKRSLQKYASARTA